MKTLNKTLPVLVLCICSIFSGYTQISDLIPSWAFGDDPSYQNIVIESWIGSGSPSINSGSLYINNIIDVSDYGIYPGIYDNTAFLINDLLKNQLPPGNSIVYFPPGIYYLEEGIKIYSNTIIKGNGGDADDPARTEFHFDYSDDLPLYKSVSISFARAQNSGIEDIYLFDETDPLIGVEPNQRYEDLISIPSTSSNIWIRGVESYLTRRFHVNIYGNRVTVSGCYFHHSWSYSTGGRGYGVCLSKDSHFCRIENNIFNHLRHSMLFQYNAKQNVVSYNYSWDVHAINGGFDYKASDLDFHGRHDDDLMGPAWNLCEGNKVERIFFDDLHEQNGPHNTIFRCNAYSDHQELKVEKVQGSNHQFMQNVVGTNAWPYEGNNTRKWILEYGFAYWDGEPDYSEIPSNQSSYYLYDRPDFYDLNTNWLPWPFIPYDEAINPAKYRYDRNHGYYQNDPPQHEVVYARIGFIFQCLWPAKISSK
ncbi:MAG: glycosyl hydrolase family 28-related protein [Bacteroidales bacterium]